MYKSTNLITYFTISVLTPCYYKQVIDQSKGVASSCKSVGGKRVKTVADCKAIAQAKNANAFNWKGGWCHYKKCASLDDLKTGKNQGGWNVFISECQEGGEYN